MTPCLDPFRVLTTNATAISNYLTPGLIAWKIWRVDHECSKLIALPRQKRSRLENAMRISVASGLVYTIFVVLSLITEAMRSKVAYVVEQIVCVLLDLQNLANDEA